MGAFYNSVRKFSGWRLQIIRRARTYLTDRQFLGVVTALLLGLGLHSQAQAGDPAVGAGGWVNATANCSNCHGATPSATSFQANALTWYANNPPNIATAVNPGYAYGGCCNSSTSMDFTGQRSVLCTNTTTGTTCTASTIAGGAGDIAAYIATFIAPVVTNPGTITYGSAAVVSNAITGTYFVTSATAGWSTAFSATGLPTGVTINATTGVISGTTPTVSSPTNYSVTVTATNKNNATGGTATFTFTVNPPVPVVTSPTVANVLVNTPFSYTITGTYSPTSWWGWGTLPTGLTPANISVAGGASVPSGLISGTPTQIGSFPITVWAWNVSGWSAGQATTINVWGITSATTASGTVGTTFPGYTITTNGTVAGSYTASGLPPGLSVSASTGAITGIPTAAGSFAVTVNALTTLGTVSQVVTFTIAKGTQTISFGAAPTITVGTSGSDAATVNSGLTLSYSTLSTGCSVNASTGLVTGVHAGTANCAITASQGGDANWNAATLTQTAFNIGQGTQTITVPTLTPASISVGGTSTASGATSSVGLTPVTYSSSAGCTASGTNGSTITGNSVGTCTITASQAGNTDYLPASSAPASLTVGLNAQTITWTATPPVVYGTGNSVTWTATATSTLTPVTFSSTGGCTVASAGLTSATVTGTAAGTNNCAITATQAGNGTWGVATSTLTVSVAKANQTNTFTSTAPAATVGGATYTPTATATSGLTVAITVDAVSSSICSITGGVVSFQASGSCVLDANQAGNGNYVAATQVQQTVTVGKGGQTISFTSTAPAAAVGGATYTPTATATSGLTVAITVDAVSSSICSITGGVVSFQASGSCVLDANQAGNGNYVAATQVQQTVTVGKGGQTISFTSTAPAATVGGATYTPTATATSGLPVTITVNGASSTICTIVGGVVSFQAAGACVLNANQLGSGNYVAATQVQQTVTVGAGGQTIGAISFSPATLSVGGTTTASATATSGLAVTFTSTTTGVCTVSGTNGSTVTAVTTGTCTIAANQAGNPNYTAAAAVNKNIVVGIAAAPVVAMNAQLNMPSTIDLSYLPGITGVSIVTTAAHGTVTVKGTQITYTPANNYFGTDTFTYVYYAGGVASTSAAINVTIIGRPDPTKDTNVSGLINSQVDTANRFWRAQLSNYQQRLESRHHAAQSGLAMTAKPATKAMALAEQDGNFAGTGGMAQNNSQPMLTAKLNDPMQTPGASNDGSGAFSSMLASTVKTALTSSSVNLATFFNHNQSAQDTSDDLEIWGAGNLRFGNKNQPAGGAGTNFTTDGTSIGMDRRFGEQLTLGMGIGYASDKSSIGVDGTGSTSTGNSVAAYASYQSSPTMFIDGLLGYGTLNMNTTRFVAPINDFARARRNGSQLFGSLTTGYEYRDGGFLMSPYARYDFAVDHLKPTTETGAGLYALFYGGQSTKSQQISFGLRTETKHQTDFGWAQPRARIEYQRHLEGNNQATIAYADQYNLTPYNLALPTLSTNSLLIGVGSGFALHNGLNLDLDYQRMRAFGRENNQALNFRLSKQLDGKPITSPFTDFSPATGFMADAGYTYDNNVSRADDAADKRSDSSLTLNLSKSGSMPLSDFTRLVLNGFLGVEQFRTYTGLGHAFGGMQGDIRYRSSGEFGTPTLGIFVRAMADQYQSSLRSGYRYSSGLSVREEITDRINFFGAVANNGRRGKSAVFDTNDNSVRMNLDYAMPERKALYLTGEYHKGDIVFSGQPSLAIVDIATVFIHDDVFTAPQFYDYRVKGKTVMTTLGYNLPLGPQDSLDFSWRRAQSTPDKTPTFPAPGIRYIDNQILVDYLMAF